MRYALSLDENGRVLSATFEKYAPKNAVPVDELPEGNIYDFKFIDGKFVRAPVLPDPKVVAKRTVEDLKRRLADTDYNILKIVEGAATLSEMAETIKKRALWRKEINELEEQYEL